MIAVSTNQHDVAWDVGTGSGQAAVSLAEHFSRVVATDSSEEQIRHAHAHPRVTYSVSPAEKAPEELAANQCDAVTVANAVHWFDTNRFFQEVQRVLRPGGVVAVWCYSDVAADGNIKLVLDSLKSLVKPYWPNPTNLVTSKYRDLEFPFEEIETPEFAMEKDWTFDECLGYLSTWSAVGNYRKETGKDPIKEVRERFAGLASDSSSRYSVRFPLPLRLGRKI